MSGGFVEITLLCTESLLCSRHCLECPSLPTPSVQKWISECTEDLPKDITWSRNGCLNCSDRLKRPSYENPLSASGYKWQLLSTEYSWEPGFQIQHNLQAFYLLMCSLFFFFFDISLIRLQNQKKRFCIFSIIPAHCRCFLHI